MEIKTVEVRDSMTFIPALAIKLDPMEAGDMFLCARAGLAPHADGGPRIILLNLNNMAAQCDAYEWIGNRTMQTVHHFLDEGEGFAGHQSGGVIDVQFLLGETPEKKTSERFNDK